MPTQKPLEEIVSDLRSEAGSGQMTIGSTVKAFEDRPAGVLVTLLAFLALIPFIGGLPGAPFIIAGLILAVLFKSFFGGGGIWLPDRIAERPIPQEKFNRGLDVAAPWARRVDSLTSERLRVLVGSRSAKAAIFACVTLLAVALIPLGLIPAGIAPAALGLLLFGLAVMAQDGLLAIIGYALSAASGYLIVQFL